MVELSSSAIGLRASVPSWLLARGHPQFLMWASPIQLFALSKQNEKALGSGSKMKVTIFCNLLWKWHSVLFAILLVWTKSVGHLTLKGGITQECKFRKGSWEIILGVCLPKELHFYFLNGEPPVQLPPLKFTNSSVSHGTEMSPLSYIKPHIYVILFRYSSISCIFSVGFHGNTILF